MFPAMRQIAAALTALTLLATPAAAQEEGDPSDIRDGLDQLSEGARTLMRGLMGQVEPEMRDLAEALRQWDFQGIDVNDLGRYHPPEVLPNGDIIIRRKEPLDNPMDNEIEL